MPDSDTIYLLHSVWDADGSEDEWEVCLDEGWFDNSHDAHKRAEEINARGELAYESYSKNYNEQFAEASQRYDIECRKVEILRNNGFPEESLPTPPVYNRITLAEYRARHEFLTYTIKAHKRAASPLSK